MCACEPFVDDGIVVGVMGEQAPRLLDVVRHALRARHYSRRTEEAYVHWIRRFIVFHGKRHPRELGAAEVSRFVAWLAVEQCVATTRTSHAATAPFVPRRSPTFTWRWS